MKQEPPSPISHLHAPCSDEPSRSRTQPQKTAGRRARRTQDFFDDATPASIREHLHSLDTLVRSSGRPFPKVTRMTSLPRAARYTPEALILRMHGDLGLPFKEIGWLLGIRSQNRLRALYEHACQLCETSAKTTNP